MRTYASEKHATISGNGTIDLECDFVVGKIVNGVKKTLLYSFALDKIPREFNLRTLNENTQKINGFVLNEIMFYVKVDRINKITFSGDFLTFVILLMSS